MKKRIIVSAILLLFFALPIAFAQEATQAAPAATNTWIKYIAAAVAVGLATIGGGIAVGQIGAAAMAAMSENPDLSGKALPFVGMAEGICLWGFIVALMILSAA
jgi:V/A-type H+-transporting ATPase subunit K